MIDDGSAIGTGRRAGSHRADAAHGAALAAQIAVRRSTFTLSAEITAAPGEIMAVLGPNGAGKSTLLAVLAGLLRPDEGAVTLDGRILTGSGVAVPPERREVGLMGQDPLLFPHLSALENVAFGPRSHGTGRVAARRSAADWLGRMGLADFAHRKPAQLSGGQRQRVALARALAAEPKLLLLDEPLGALDAQTAPEIRQLLRTHLREAGVTALMVTHDVLDAVAIADSVIVLVDGAIVDTGPTSRVLGAPSHPFTAALAGLNMVDGAATSDAEAAAPVTVEAGLHGMAAEPLTAGDHVIAVFPPAAVSVYLDPPGVGSPRNTWPATVTALEPGPSSIRVRVAVDPAEPGVRSAGSGDRAETRGAVIHIAAELTAAAVAELDLQPGTRVYLTVKATEVRVHVGPPPR